MKTKSFGNSLLRLLGVIGIIALTMVWNSCDKATQPANPNMAPNTTLANVPRENDTLFALQTLYWDGEDLDGFVSGYEYRYTTYRLVTGDSVVQDWKFTKETSLVIAFLSDDPLNKQKFEVRAIDNNGTIDPNPAQKIVYTYKTIFPETRIRIPAANSQYFAIDHISDWWAGVELSYIAEDKDEGGGIVEYAWSVDDGSWNWTQDTIVHITPDRFKAPLNGQHKIKVTSRDNTNLVDPIGDSVFVNFVVPSFEKRILVIDETNEANFPYGVVRPTDAQVDEFYSDIFEGSDSWDFKAKGMPPRDTLGLYQLVVWHADDLPFSQPHKLPANIEVIKDYLNVGGKFFMSGWRILKSFAWTDPFPISFQEGSFVHDYLHIISVDETPIEGDCFGFTGVGGNYSDIRVDSTKIVDFPYLIPGVSWGIGQVNLIIQPAGFTDKIYAYKNADNSPYFQYRGRPSGLRYYGSSFDAVILGFPVYFIRRDDAHIMVQEILRNLNLK